MSSDKKELTNDPIGLHTRIKLDRVWTLILDQYREYSKKISKEEGAGINVFNMKDKKNSLYNCEYFYDIQGGSLWMNSLIYSPNRYSILKEYDSETMYMILVQIQKSEERDDIFGNIRIFKFDTDEEVPLPAIDPQELIEFQTNSQDSESKNKEEKDD